MKKFLLLTCIIFSSVHLFAVAPNDSCSGALLLTPKPIGSAATDLYQDLGNSSNVLANFCSGNYYLDLWYYFVATNDTAIVFMYSHTSGMLPQLELLSGNCGSLTSIECGGSSGVKIYSGLTPGNTYYIRTYDFSTQIKYDITLLEPAGNDVCQSAFPLNVYRYDQPYEGQLEFWTYGSTEGGFSCPLTGDDYDVWFDFTATDTVHNIFFDGIGSYFTYEYFSGNCGSLTSKGCRGLMNADHGVLNDLTIGQHYYLRLYSDIPLSSGYKFRLTLTTLPSNNQCQGAITIPVSNSFSEEIRESGDLWFTTPSSGSCNSSLNDVWYKFTANANEAFIKTLAGSETKVSVYSGGCASLNPIICADSSNNKVTGLTSGNTYYIQLGKTDLSQSFYSIAVTPPLNNDDCSGAVTMQPDDISSNPNALEATLYDATQSMPPCAGSQAKDVWFKFTAGKQNYTLYATIPDFNTVGSGFIYEVFSGNCGSLTSMKCDTVKSSGDPINGLTIGQQYYIRMYNAPGNTYHFRVGLVNGYDECEGAQLLQLTTAGSTVFTQAYTTVNATQSMLPCTGTSAKDVWFRFTATQTHHSYIISDRVPDQAYPVVELFSGSCGSLTSLQCKSGLGYVFDNLTPGQQYFVRVYSSGQFLFSNFKIRIFSSPQNDDISNAIRIPVTSSYVMSALNQVTAGATANFGNFCAGGTTGVFEDVWYYFVAPQTAQYITAATFGITANDFGIEAYSAYNTTAAIQASQVSCGSLTMAIPQVGTINAGDTIWLRVYSDTTGGTYSGAFDLAVYPDGAPNNDEPAEALELYPNNTYQYIYTTSSMSLSTINNSCITTTSTAEDLWFKFTATNVKSTIISDEMDNRGSSTEVFSGSPGNLTSLGCSDNIMELSSLTPGQQYYLRVYHPSYTNARIGYFINDTLEKNNLVSINCLGPNLVPNPSMDCSTCYDECRGGVVITGTKYGGDELTDDWFMATDGSVDYYNSCVDAYYNTGNAPSSSFGFSTDKYLMNDIVPRNGKGYMGLYAHSIGDYREYPEVKLTQPLVPGTTYLVSFYVAKGVSSSFAINQLGALLTCDKVLMSNPNGGSSNLIYYLIPQEPQIAWNDSFFIEHTNKWTNVAAVFTADKPYRYLTVGNFKSNAETQVLVPAVPDPTVFSSVPYTSYLLLDDVVVAEIPSVLDDSCKAAVVAIQSNEIKQQEFYVYPNPSNSVINWKEMKGMQNITVYNINGSVIYNGVTTRNQLNISSYLPGIYLIRIQNSDEVYVAKFIRKE